MRLIDKLLGRITMYRLMLYYLLVLLAAAMVFGAIGYMPYSPVAIAGLALYLVVVCWITNKIFAQVFTVSANPESTHITALILALIITPPPSAEGYAFVTAAGGLAVASKYILAINKKHVFNPAAVAVALTALGAGQSASWWVGTAWMTPLVFAGGLLVARKIERGRMVAVFVAVALATTVGFTALAGGNVGTTLQTTLLHSPLFFLAFVMLTEPLTSPATAKWQAWYAALAGALLPPQVHVLGLYSTPELDVVVANMFSYLVSPKAKLLLRLGQKVAWGPSVCDFVFPLDKPLPYKPGQYMEFTLSHLHTDSRGVRRYLTLASSPTENNLRVGVKFYKNGSSFKKALAQLTHKTSLAAAQLGGDFVLPDHPNQKLAFIAGGIGITPFRSMLKYMVDTGSDQPATLLYAERDVKNFAYTDVFRAAAEQPHIKIVYTVTGQTANLPDGVRSGRISAQLVQAEIPDYPERLFYISGSPPMVDSVRTILRALGVPARHIKTDSFSGYT